MTEKEKIALVTGATSGIGKATAIGLAKLGMTVVVASLDKSEGERSVDEIKRTSGNSQVELIICNLSLQTSVRAASEEFRRRFNHLDILVNNAAIFMAKRVVTDEGFELMIATNHLGPFLLTNLLLDSLEVSETARVINMTAPSTVRPELADLQSERKFRSARAFGATKAENLLFTYALARKLKGGGVTVNAYFPGITRTNLLRNAPLFIRFTFGFLLRPFFRTPTRSAEGVVQLATSSEFNDISGELIHDGKIIKAPFQSDTGLQEQLWDESVKLVRLV